MGLSLVLDLRSLLEPSILVSQPQQNQANDNQRHHIQSMIINQRPPQIFSRLFLQATLKVPIADLKRKIQLEKMPFFIINIDVVRDLFRVDGEICGFEELLLWKVELEVDCEVVAFAWAEGEGRQLLGFEDWGVFGGSGCPIAVSWLGVETCQPVDPYLAIRTCYLLVLYAQMSNVDLYCPFVDYLKASLAFNDTVLLSVIGTEQLDVQLSCSLLAPGLFLHRKFQLKLADLRKDSYFRILKVNSQSICLKLRKIVGKY